MISKGRSSWKPEEVLGEAAEGIILRRYLGITTVPCSILSPLREDRKPSFYIYSPDGKRIMWRDYATQDWGNLYNLFSRLWGTGYQDTLSKIAKDFSGKCFGKGVGKKTYESNHQYFAKIRPKGQDSELKVKTREWEDYDVEYWKSYGVSLKWLKWADVYPISHIIYVKDKQEYAFKADKLAYAFVEHKEGKVTMKVYQPLNTFGCKWRNKHDGSVVSLWTKVPEKGDRICICSSVKDALCLSANAHIPAVALQGEGFRISDAAMKELQRRYKKVYILFDNDKAGLIDGEKLAKETGFINLVLPSFEGGKDVSDLYKVRGKEEWQRVILTLFKTYFKKNRTKKNKGKENEKELSSCL